MALFQAFRELSDGWIILVLLLDLIFFGYLAFRLGRDGDRSGGRREGLLLEPEAVRVKSTEVWREKR